MKQFDISLWLKDKSRKVVTRDGRVVKILDTEFESGNGNKSVLAKCIYNNKAAVYVYTTDGKANNIGETENDLFFADEKDELTELQKTLEEDCDCYVKLYNEGKTRVELREWIKGWCPRIIDLAREEDWRTPVRAYKNGYEQGKQDALKDLPKWKKATEHIDMGRHVAIIEDDKVILSDYVEEDEYYIVLDDLKTLPKEE